MKTYKGHKLPTPSENSDEVMTERDWERYFECRKKCDRILSESEKNKLFDEILKLDPMDPNEENEWFRLNNLMPLAPSVALASKRVFGIKEIIDCNLSEAKKAYPDEF